MRENKIVFEFLIELGIYPSTMGFKYLYDLLVLNAKGERIFPLKRYGYTQVANRYGKTTDNVDKSIQNVISSIFQKGNIRLIDAIFGNTVDENRGKPGNKQFICTATEYLGY